MKLCVISDLHCKYQHDITAPSETYLFSNSPRRPIFQHPVVAMLNAIENDESIKSDVLLCLGDLGDKANEQGIISAWSFVEEIRQKLGADIKIGIPGNHDINSKGQDGKDAFSYIKNFHESYPTNEDDANNKLWSKGYCILRHKNVLFLLINTVFDHTTPEKAKTSEIRPEILEEIKKQVKLSEEGVVKKICLLHHHPIKYSNITYKDGDSLEKGDDLIRLLAELNFTMVIHGHKHQPRLVEYNGITIFATGSFSSFANLQGTGFHTMFHVIDLADEGNFGKIYSWEYNIKDGWNKVLNKKFPDQIGFGKTVDLDAIAQFINDEVKKDGTPKIYDNIIAIKPELEYLVPEKLVQLGEILEKRYGIYAKPEFPLVPSILTLPKK